MSKFCPICQSRYKGSYYRHHCRPQTLAAIDSANHDDGQTGHVPDYTERLAHGNMLIGLSTDEGADDDDPFEANVIDA